MHNFFVRVAACFIPNKETRRRFLNAGDVNKQITGLGLTILSSDEAANRAPFNGTNYKFLRIIARNHLKTKGK